MKWRLKTTLAVVRVAMLSLMFLTLAQIASAKGWDVDVRAFDNITAVLNRLDPTKAGYSCPEHFHPVRLSVEIDEFKKMTVKAIGSEFFHSNVVDQAIAEENLTLSLKVSVLGCAYKQHLLVRKCYVAANGDLGVGRMENVRFLYADDQDDNTLSAAYRAYIANPPAEPSARDAEAAGSSESIQPIGFFTLAFDWEPTFLADAKREGDWVHLGLTWLRIKVLPEDN